MPKKTLFPVLYSRYYPVLPADVGNLNHKALKEWIKEQQNAGVTLVPREYRPSGSSECN
jgi:hypothetical protein